MSPEQVEGGEVDSRTDLYSLGIILYECLVGRVPFEGDTPFSVGIKQKSEKPGDPRGLNPEIPEDLARLILKCLEKDPNYGYGMNMLAYTFADMGDYAKAIEIFKRYAAVSPSDANPLDSLAETYLWMGDLEKSITT
jgi:serine/threonine protein kinase